MLRKLILSTTLMMLSSLSFGASLSDDLNSYANDIGYANITGASASMMQEGGYLAAGSGYLATGVKNLQLAHVQMPNITAGCGGIDWTFGGLSFISSDQLTQFGQAIIQNAVPYTVDLALQTWAPQIKAAKDKFMSIANEINNTNISSCQAAQLAVGGVAGWFADDEQKKFICQSYKSQNNKASGWLAEQQGCSSGDAESANESAKKDANYKDMVKANRNIVWYQFMQNSFLADNPEIAEYLMSMTGSVIYPAKSGDTVAPLKLSPLIVDSNTAGFKELLYGTTDKTDVQVYECDSHDAEGCKNPKIVKLKIDQSKAMVKKVQTLLEDIGTKFSNDEAMTDEESNLLNSVDFPIGAILQNEIRAGWPPQYPQYADIISRVVLANYISQILISARTAIAKNKAASTDEDFKSIVKNLENAQTIILNNYQTRAYDALKQRSDLVMRAIEVQNLVVGGLSSQTKDNYSFQGI